MHVTLKTKVEAEFKCLVDGYLLYVVVSRYAIPIVAVLKMCGSVCIFVYYRGLLKDLEVESYPLPIIYELFTAFQKGEIFSKIKFESSLYLT